MSEDLKTIWRYDPNTGLFYWKVRRQHVRLGAVAGCVTKKGYVHLHHAGKSYRAHRVAWYFMTGSWPPPHTKLHVEHCDGNKANNRWSNLALVTQSKNLQNLNDKLKRNNKSGYRGVYLKPNLKKATAKRWRADITVEKRPILLGYFVSRDDAIAARKAAERRYFAADRQRTISDLPFPLSSSLCEGSPFWGPRALQGVDACASAMGCTGATGCY
jgi:hypothetical protein